MNKRDIVPGIRLHFSFRIHQQNLTIVPSSPRMLVYSPWRMNPCSLSRRWPSSNNQTRYQIDVLISFPLPLLILHPRHHPTFGIYEMPFVFNFFFSFRAFSYFSLWRSLSRRMFLVESVLHWQFHAFVLSPFFVTLCVSWITHDEYQDYSCGKTASIESRQRRDWKIDPITLEAGLNRNKIPTTHISSESPYSLSVSVLLYYCARIIQTYVMLQKRLTG